MVNIQEFLNEKYSNAENKKKVKSLVLVWGAYNQKLSLFDKEYNSSNSDFYDFKDLLVISGNNKNLLEGDLNLNEFINLEDLIIYPGGTGVFQMSNIIVDNCPKLKKFVVYANNKNLKKVNVANNKELKILFIQYCSELTKISYPKEQKQLTQLNLSYNQLTNVDLKEQKQLTQLNLNNNQLTNVDLKEQKQLTYLYLNNNQLTNVVGLSYLSNNIVYLY